MAIEVDYPANLPCVSRIDGYAMQASAAVIRTPFGVAASTQRRTHAQMPMQMQIAWRVDNDGLNPLFQWLNQYGYDWFNIDLSGVESSKILAFKSPIAIRLITDLTVSLIRIHRQNWWVVSTSAEYYPPLGSRAYEPPLFLQISQATHAHTADNVALATPVRTLTIQDSHHAMTSDTPNVLPSSIDFAVQEALHAHAADNVVLNSSPSLVISDAAHSVTSDNLGLLTGSMLVIQDATHAHAADNLSITPSGPTLQAFAYNSQATVSDGDLVLLWFIGAGVSAPSAPTGWTRHLNTTELQGYAVALYSSVYDAGDADANTTNFPVGNGYFYTLVYPAGTTIAQFGTFTDTANGASNVTVTALGSTTGANSTLAAFVSSRDPQLDSLTSSSGMTQEIYDQSPTFFDFGFFEQFGAQSGSRTFNRTASFSLSFNFNGYMIELV